MSFRDVPENPCSAKQRRASARIASRVDTVGSGRVTLGRVPVRGARRLL
jgi:hypothetical protein